MRFGLRLAMRGRQATYGPSTSASSNGNPVNKNAAYDKQYLAGRYGADPYLTRIEEWA